MNLCPLTRSVFLGLGLGLASIGRVECFGDQRSGQLCMNEDLQYYDERHGEITLLIMHLDSRMISFC